MSAPAACELIGRWRIAEADLWDREYLDLVEPAYIAINKNGRGAFAFGVVNATIELEYAKNIVFFTWDGFDEGDEISGSGSAELDDNGNMRSSYPSTMATMPSSKPIANDFFNSLLD